MAEFFGGRSQRTIPATPNPTDRSTVVSIYHQVIREFRPTCSPGQFVIPPGTRENPTAVIIGPSSWWHATNPDQPPIEVTNSSVQMAESIVRDWANGLLGCQPPNVMPGVFWLPGAHSSKDVIGKFAGELQKAEMKQNRWYEVLINKADGIWNQTGGNPMAITNDMRIAARAMKLDNKDWMQNFTALAQERCGACGTLKDPAYPVCPACHAIDENHPRAKGLKFA